MPLTSISRPLPDLETDTTAIVKLMPDKHKGTTAPDFTATDADGRTIRLSDYTGKKHVVLVFNRGFS